MVWAKKYFTNIEFDGEVLKVECHEDEEFAVYVDGEYMTDLDELPSESELIEIIKEYREVDSLSDMTNMYGG